jgi:hypothetical protein
MPAMTETEATTVPLDAEGIAAAKSASDLARQAKAHQVVAYLFYALDDVRALSPTGAFLLEMSIVALNEDMHLTQWSLQDFADQDP